MVFSGVQGAPGQSFPTPPYPTLETTPISREKPFLYLDGADYRVFLPKKRSGARGTTWGNGTPRGTSLTAVLRAQGQRPLGGATRHDGFSPHQRSRPPCPAAGRGVGEPPLLLAPAGRAPSCTRWVAARAAAPRARVAPTHSVRA